MLCLLEMKISTVYIIYLKKTELTSCIGILPLPIHHLKLGRESPTEERLPNVPHLTPCSIIRDHFLLTYLTTRTALSAFARSIEPHDLILRTDLGCIDVQFQLMVGIAAASSGQSTIVGFFHDTEFIAAVVGLDFVLVSDLAQVAEGVHVDGIGGGICEGFERLELLFDY